MPYAHPSGFHPRAQHGEGVVLSPVARGPVPRERSMARETLSHARVACEGPSPTVKGGVFYPHYRDFNSLHRFMSFPRAVICPRNRAVASR